MKWIQRESALIIFYYLMWLDGEITPQEQEVMDGIGTELLGEQYENCRETILSACQAHIHTAVLAEERLDVIQEGVDQALTHTTEREEEGVTCRMLLWDLLTMAFSDGYTAPEQRLVRHIGRVLSLERSVLLEMEQLLKTLTDLQQSLASLQQSERPYREIWPLVDETKRRIIHLQESGRLLIQDELLLAQASAPNEQEESPLANAGKMWSKTVAPMADEAKKAAAGVARAAEAKTEEVKNNAAKLFDRIKRKETKH